MSGCEVVLTWLAGIAAKEAVKETGKLYIKRLRGTALEAEISAELRAWEKDVQETYRPGIQSNVLPHIFRPLGNGEAPSGPEATLHDSLNGPGVPSERVWLDVVMSKWREIHESPPPLQEFFANDISVVRPYLEDLAERLFRVCKQNDGLFKSAVYDLVFGIKSQTEATHQVASETHHLLSKMRLEILQALTETGKRAVLAPGDNDVPTWKGLPASASKVAPRCLEPGMDVVGMFAHNPRSFWRDPNMDIKGIWHPGSQKMMPIQTPQRGWVPPPICMPSYEVDVEWRLPSYVRGPLWGPVKDRVVREFVAAHQGKSVLCRVVQIRKDGRNETILLNSGAYNKWLRNQSPYYRGLEAALAINRWWKSPRMLHMTDAELRQVIDRDILPSDQLQRNVPDQYRAEWRNRSIDAEEAFLVLNGLRKREHGSPRRSRKK